MHNGPPGVPPKGCALRLQGATDGELNTQSSAGADSVLRVMTDLKYTKGLLETYQMTSCA